MTNYHLEVERKYEFLGAEELPVMIDWSVLEGLSAENPVEEHLEATYFDTNDQDLSRNLVALRRRIGGATTRAGISSLMIGPALATR